MGNVSVMRPIRLLREQDEVRVHYLDNGAELTLSATADVEVIPANDDGEDAVTVEVADPTMLTLRQVGEDGEAQTLAMSPMQLAQLSRIIDSLLVFPKGITNQ